MSYSKGRVGTVLLVALIVLWLGVPAGRAAFLVESHGGDRIRRPVGLPVRSIEFPAADGVRLSGWVLAVDRKAPIVILVPGFKADRMSMLPYAHFLHAGGYNVLLYDSRGTGESGGHFTVGAREVEDVLGAVTYASRRLGDRIGLLGVSLGARDAIVAAARDHRVRATVADSGYTDQDAVMTRLDRLHIIGPFAGI